MFRFVFGTMCLGALVFAGCGGSDSTTLGGVDSSATIASLSPSDAMKVCMGLVSEFPAADICTLVGAAAELGGESCATTEEACMKAPPLTSSSCSSASTVLAGCTATVGQLSTCVSALSSALGGVSCSSTPSDLVNAESSVVAPCELLATCTTISSMIGLK